ncbi:MAG: ankyrin repeat domain-containing protein [Deltaproteobacteria bacterium]|nr:ankyrin repeat domain-containing protein [Deltaproteobacteria bacterium]
MHDKKMCSAIKNNDLGEVQRLINIGKGVDREIYCGWNSLHYAIRFGKIDIIKMLIERGANIDGLSSAREHPLDLAFAYDQYEVANLLIIRGSKSKRLKTTEFEETMYRSKMKKIESKIFDSILNLFRKNIFEVSELEEPITCSICLEEVDEYCEDVWITPCDHKFHRSCLENWKGNCPNCRKPL